ncbi:MAG: hypothetical protein AB9835_14345 [Eubacteriales bacterium]
MNKQMLKTLKKINAKPILASVASKKFGEETCCQLIKDHLINYEDGDRSPDGNFNNPFLEITGQGEDFLFNHNQEKFRFWFPVIVSILALILAGAALTMQIIGQ